MKENKWGWIINVASIHSVGASPFKVGYITAKHALAGLTKAISANSAKYGITSNAIAPFYVNIKFVIDQVESQAEAWRIRYNNRPRLHSSVTRIGLN